MQKSILSNLISKYNTIGKIESVVWEIDDDKLKTRFISDDKSMLGEVCIFNFKSDYNGSKLGIYKTSQFAKLLSVLENEISSFSIEKIVDKLISIKLSDANTKVNYALSDISVIPNVPVMKHIPSNFELCVKIDDDFSNLYLKAISALPEVVSFSIQAKDDNNATITLGQTDVNTNRVILNVSTLKNDPIDKLSFNSTLFADILSANKGVDAQFEISNEGLGKIVFETKEYYAKYYLVAKKN